VPAPAEMELRVLRVTVGVLRLQRGLSQYEVGSSGELDDKYVGKLERGELAPSFRALVGVARGLGMSSAEFFRTLADDLETAARRA
jgi:transcriptional regulator with XRE-family HTH domain